MKLEQQVVSLELAKKLKELGVSQQSLFWWEWYITTEIKKSTDIPPKIVYLPNKPSTGGKPLRNAQHYAAFTVAELGEMLPARVRKFKLQADKMPGGDWFVSYVSFLNCDEKKFIQYSYTEADARAKMLIYLIENELLDPKTLSI